MNDSTVVAGLMKSQPRLFFQNQHPKPWVAIDKAPSRRKSDDAPADNYDVKRCFHAFSLSHDIIYEIFGDNIPMRVLITGGAGFIGSHLCDRFLTDKHQVLCVDNFITGREENVQRLISNSAFELIQQDISQPLAVEGQVDCVLHFASPASPPDYLRYPIQTLQAGSLGTFHTLELAKEKGARFLLASTSEVYGDPQVHPQPETYWGHVNPIGPRAVYDEAKRFAEALTMAYHREHGVDTRIARIFNCYGSRMRQEDGRAIPNFITQALSGEPLTVYGDGTQTRSFCYIDDLIEGIVHLLSSNLHEPVNLGNPREISLLELARFVLLLTGSRGSITFQPTPVDDPKFRCPDIRLAKEHLGWEPRVELQDGLRATVGWFRQERGRPRS